MTTLPSNSKPRLDQGIGASADTVQLTVTGVDTKGQMFRHAATVLYLNGRDCTYRSKSQPELDGSILAEFGYPNAVRRVSQGRVTSNHVEISSGLYKVSVELEAAQPANVVTDQAAPQVVVQKPAPPQPTPQLASIETNRDSEFTDVDFPAPPKPSGVLREFPQPNHENIASVKYENREFASKTPPEDPEAVRASVKLIVDSEMKVQTPLLKSWISDELEKAVPTALSSSMVKIEKMIDAAVEKQVSASHQSSQAFNVDLARQIGDRIAESADLRNALESMAKRLIEEQTEISQAAGVRGDQQRSSEAATIIRSFEAPVADMEARLNASSVKAQQELDSRADAITRSLESSAAQIEAKIDAAPARIEQQLGSQADTILRSLEASVAEMESRMNRTRAEMEAVLDRARHIKQEVDDGIIPIQETLAQLTNAEKAGIERFQKQVAEQLASGATQFENQLNNISAVRTIAFVMELDKHLEPHRERTEEAVDKLGAVLQLVHGTARVQQERLAEISHATVANFEKEIRAILLRLAGNAQ